MRDPLFLPRTWSLWRAQRGRASAAIRQADRLPTTVLLAGREGSVVGHG